MKIQSQTSYEESRRLIRKAMIEHNLVLFVGSGTALDAGMPSWGNAVSRIASRLGMQVDASNMLKIPQYYFDARGKKDYTALMRQIFKYNIPLQPQHIHEQMIAFDTDIIVTTNYDHLIEAAAEKSGQIFHVVSRDAELPYKHGKELIKMHGDFEHDNFVLKEDDYLDYRRNFKLIWNYIVSLAGTKTFLFIGYSFSDPDIKQIFSWLKDALGEDLQRAYMISLDTPDGIQAEYFKNFGINIIYTENISFWPTEEENELPKTLILEKTLDWILHDNDSNLLDKLYQRMGAYQYLKLPYVMDVRYAVQSVGLFTNEEIPLSFDHEESKKIQEKNVAQLINKDGVQTFYRLSCYIKDKDVLSLDFTKYDLNIKNKIILFLKLCYMADRLAKDYTDRDIVRNQLWYQKLEKLSQYGEWRKEVAEYSITREDAGKLNTILKILAKAGFDSIRLTIGRTGKPLFSIPLPKIKVQDSEFEQAIDFFDFTKLQKLEQENDNWLLSKDAKLLMEQAHICYARFKYVKAYNLSKEAAALYYRQPNYAKYFIAKFDQYYLGRPIINGFLMETITEKQRKRINEEVEQINLDKVFNSLPALPSGYFGNGSKNKFLKDLYSFNLVYEMFYDIIKETQKAREEAKTTYTFYGGTPAYQNLRCRTFAFYQYQQKNHFFVNSFSEVRLIYRLVVRALLDSVLTDDIVTKKDGINPNNSASANIHEKVLRAFDLLLIVRFSDSSELKKLLGYHESINLSASGKDYLLIITKNFAETQVNNFLFQEYFRRILILCGHIILTSELVEHVLHMLKAGANTLDLIESYYTEIRDFLLNIERQNLVQGNESLVSLLKEFVAGVLDFFVQSRVNDEITPLGNLCVFALRNLRKTEKEYTDVSQIQQIIQSSVRNIRKISLFACIFPYCSEKIKAEMKEKCLEWKPYDDLECYEVYTMCVQNEILSLTLEIEKQFYHFLIDYHVKYEEHHKNKEHKFQDDRVIHWIYDLVGLALTEKLNPKEELKKICKQYRLEAAIWFLDFNNEEAFTSFNTQWLRLCSDSLIQKIADNPSLREKIAIHMKQEYLMGDLDDDLVRYYFKFFA